MYLPKILWNDILVFFIGSLNVDSFFTNILLEKDTDIYANIFFENAKRADYQKYNLRYYATFSFWKTQNLFESY